MDQVNEVERLLKLRLYNHQTRGRLIVGLVNKIKSLLFGLYSKDIEVGQDTQNNINKSMDYLFMTYKYLFEQGLIKEGEKLEFTAAYPKEKRTLSVTIEEIDYEDN